MNRKNKKDINPNYTPADSCIICHKQLKEIGGKRIIAQIPRGIVVSDTENTHRYANTKNSTISQLQKPSVNKKSLTRQAHRLSENPDKYLIVWGEELQTDDVIERAKREYSEDKQSWFCQVCGDRTCWETKIPMQHPMGSSLLDDNGNTWSISNLPITPGCL